MSDVDNKWPRNVALVVAGHMVELLGPCCSRIEVAGSLRRGKRRVGDIELVFIPRVEMQPDPSDLFGSPIEVNLAERLIGRLESDGIIFRRKNVNGGTTWGEKNKLAVHRSSGIGIDFFATTEENYWTALVIRTGGLETNLELTKQARERGRTLHAYGCGVENLTTGEITRAASEREVFELCGVQFREPEDRA